MKPRQPNLLASILDVPITKAMRLLELVNDDPARIDNITDYQFDQLQIPHAARQQARWVAEFIRLAMQPIERVEISGPDDIAAVLFRQLSHLEQEHFMLVCLDNRNQTSASQIYTVYIGGQDGITVVPRDIFRIALEHNATRIILAHNHPAGNPEPTEEDLLIHRTIAMAGDLIGIPVIDHLIFGRSTYVSLAGLEARQGDSA